VKRLKERFQLRDRDADPGVPNRETNAVPGAGLDGDLEGDLAVRRELDRVPKQIHEDLADTERVTYDPRGHGRVYPGREIEPLLARGHGHRLDRLFEAKLERERGALDGHVPRLDLGEVEHVVDDVEQALGAAPDRGDEVRLLAREGGLLEELSEAQHAIHGSADLVAHGRQELALGAARRLGRLLRFVQRRLGPLPNGVGAELMADLAERVDELRVRGLVFRAEELENADEHGPVDDG
jgi:hypothetical protein